MVSEGEHEQGGRWRTSSGGWAARRRSSLFDCVQRDDIHTHHGKGRGYVKRALALAQRGKETGDATHWFCSSIKTIRRTRGASRSGRHRSSGIRTCLRSHLPRAMGVAIKMFDAWMLADEKALTEVLGCTVARQHDPETISQPKKVCGRLLESGTNRMAQREMYAEVALRLDIEVLTKRCPRGFKPFAERVRKMFG